MTISETLEEPAQFKSKIYSYISIGIATLIGGPIAAAYMLSKNFRAFNRPDAIIVAWPVAVMVEVGLFITLITIPQVSRLGLAIPFVYTAAALLLTKIFQGRQIVEYYSEGGDTFPYVRGVGIGLLMLVITWGILCIVSFGMLLVIGGPC